MTPINKSIAIKLPDGSYMTSTHTTCIPFTGIPEATTVAHIFPNLKSGSLLSVGQLRDYDCEAMFTKHTLSITANGNTVLTGIGSNATGGLLIMDTLPLPKICKQML
jgi:hypothetical protein